MRCVIVESPYAGSIERNLDYARRALLDCLRRGESPIASHLLYTQPGILDDADPVQRNLGIDAGHAWFTRADAIVVYTDLGISGGMERGVSGAQALGIPVEYRSFND